MTTVHTIYSILIPAKDYLGKFMRILLTSGGTKVPIDDVRHIGNMSKGNLGAEMAWHFLHNHYLSLDFLHEKGSKTLDDINLRNPCLNQGSAYNPVEYKTFDDYQAKAILLTQSNPDIIISAAAVSDYVLDKAEGKISSDEETLTITLKKAPKILPLLKRAAPDAFMVGFKLLVNAQYEDVDKAVGKVLNNGADIVVYNDLARLRSGDNTRLIFDKNLNYRVAKGPDKITEIILQSYSDWESDVRI